MQSPEIAPQHEAEEVTEDSIGDAAERLEAAKERQEIAREVANVPKTYEVDGRQICVGHKPIRVVVALNDALIGVHEIYDKIGKLKSDSDDPWGEVRKLRTEAYKFAIDALFYLINDKPFVSEPEFTREWIEENIDVTPPDGIGLQIINDYNDRMERTDFFSGLLKLPLL